MTSPGDLNILTQMKRRFRRHLSFLMAEKELDQGLKIQELTEPAEFLMRYDPTKLFVGIKRKVCSTVLA